MFEKKIQITSFEEKHYISFLVKRVMVDLYFTPVTITFCRNKTDAMFTEHVLTLEKMFQFLLYLDSKVSICFGPLKNGLRDLEKSQFFLEKTRRTARLFETKFRFMQSISIKGTIVKYVGF